jgi:hypothetical protein
MDDEVVVLFFFDGVKQLLMRNGYSICVSILYGHSRKMKHYREKFINYYDTLEEAIMRNRMIDPTIKIYERKKYEDFVPHTISDAAFLENYKEIT